MWAGADTYDELEKVEDSDIPDRFVPLRSSFITSANDEDLMEAFGEIFFSGRFLVFRIIFTPEIV